MLKNTEINFNIRSKKLAEMKIKNNSILQDLIIIQKLIKIFTFIILINPSLENQWYTKILEKKVEN